MTTYTKQSVISFLRSKNIMSVSVCGENGPISTILLFTVSDDLKTIYFATHKDSFKSKALLRDPRISMSVWSFDQMLVQMDGIATEVDDQVEAKRSLDQLVESVSRLDHFWPPVLRIAGDGYIIFKVNLSWVRVLDLSSQTIHASHDDVFTEIIL